MLRDLRPNYNQEDVVPNTTWTAILNEYFLRGILIGEPHLYCVDRQSYSRPVPGHRSAYKPDVIIVKVQTTVAPPPGAPAGTQAVSVSGDILWVEYKAPNHDTPGQWKNLIEEASDGLVAAYPTRMLFVIFAVGLKWMIFKWDPLNPSLSPLQVLGSNHNVAWTLRPELRYDSSLTGQSHVTPWNNEFIDTTAAYSLDYWMMHRSNRGNTILTLYDLLLLDRLMVHLVQTNFVGANPPRVPVNFGCLVCHVDAGAGSPCPSPPSPSLSSD